VIEGAVTQYEPILALVSRMRQHEGRNALLTRADDTADPIDYQSATVPIEITREQMRFSTLEDVLERSLGIAQGIAAQQARRMFETIQAVTQKTGNAVDARQDPKAAWLELEEKVFTDFDPRTKEPVGQVLVIHPSQASEWKRRSEEWERDPAFVAARERVRQARLEEWRAREDRRKLVD